MINKNKIWNEAGLKEIIVKALESALKYEWEKQEIMKWSADVVAERLWPIINEMQERNDLLEELKEVKKALEPFASGGEWSTWKTYMVNGPGTKEQGVAAAKEITAAQI